MNRYLNAIIVAAFMALASLAAPTKVIVSDDVNAGEANRTAIQDATERTALPKGVVSVDACPILTAKNSGLVLTGGTIRKQGFAGDWITDAALSIRAGADGKACLSWMGDEQPGAGRPTVMPAGQLGWHFGGGTLLPGFNYRIFPGSLVPQTDWFMRAWKGIPFSFAAGKTEFIVPAGHGCKANDDVWATDGVMINEAVGEFRRIVAVTAQTIKIDQPLRRSYTQGTFCFGPWPSRFSLSGLTLSGQLATLIIQQTVDVQVADCVLEYVPNTSASALNVIGCGRVEFRRCTIPSAGMSSGCGARFVDCQIGFLKAEQGQIDVVLERCKVGWLDSASGCVRWTIADCEFDQWFGVYDEWTVKDCRCNGLVYVRGRSCRVTNLKANGPVHVQHEYQGAPAGAANGVILDGIDAHYIELGKNTSGVIRNSSCVVVCSDPATKARWTRDGRPLP